MVIAFAQEFLRTLSNLAAAVVRRNLSFGHLSAGHPGRRWCAQLSAHTYKVITLTIRAGQLGLEALGFEDRKALHGFSFGLLLKVLAGMESGVLPRLRRRIGESVPRPAIP